MTAWQQISARFAGLKEREKSMSLIGALLIVTWLFVLEFIGPAYEQLTKVSQQLAIQNQTKKANNLTLQNLNQQNGTDVDASYRQSVEQLKQQEQQLQQQISALTSYFVGSERMTSVLHDVLKSSNKVKIKSVQAQPPVPVTFADKESEQKAVIYRHSTLVVLVGDYFGLMDVLKRMDALSWSLGWQSLDYKVTTYPNAELTLHLLTVSDNESYIKL